MRQLVASKGWTMEESSDFNSAVARSWYEALKRKMQWNDPNCATSDLSLSPNDVIVGWPTLYGGF